MPNTTEQVTIPLDVFATALAALADIANTADNFPTREGRARATYIATKALAEIRASLGVVVPPE